MYSRLKRCAGPICNQVGGHIIHTLTWWLSRLLCLALVVSLVTTTTACAPSQPPTSEPTPTPTLAATPTATATTVPSPTPTSTPSPLSSTQIFDLVSPAIAFVDTPSGKGSGVLINDGYVVTNFHVVWPFENVRVVFPDGSEHLEAPVLNWDPLGDLAVIGPIETEIEPLEFAGGEDLPIGSETFLIGYPGEVDKFPEPTITRGLISRVREWEPTGVTYFQTDAMIGSGQSGGVLVSEIGRVIGISSFSFSDAGFGLVASASDTAPLVEKLIAGDDVTGIGARRIPLSGGQEIHSHPNLIHEWDSAIFVINEPIDTEIEIAAASEENDIAFAVQDVFGRTSIFVDDGLVGTESDTFVAELDAPYFVDLFQYTFFSTYKPITIKANCDLAHYVDLDDGRGLLVEQANYGNLDYPQDIDHFKLVLDEGEKANILVDSITIDPFLVVGRPGDKDEQLVSDDDTGGGIFGLSAELTFLAPESDTYLVIVHDSTGSNVGGYSLRITQPDADSPTPVAPKPTATTIPSAFGSMAVYESSTAPFSIQYPATWTDDPALVARWGNVCGLATACFVGDSVLAIAEEDLSSILPSIEDLTLEEYVDLLVESMEQMGADLRLMSREQFTTAQGLTGEVIIFSLGELLQAKRFVFLHEGHAFNATYIIVEDKRDELLELADYSFSTFEVAD